MDINIMAIISLEFDSIQSIKEEQQNKEYYGYYLLSNNVSYRIRVAKQTPKKNGQFVVIWEKDNHINTAYSYESFPDYLIVYCFKDNQVGKFVFPKDVLLHHHILKDEKYKGKMAFRVYPVWDSVNSIQATKTKLWQSQYFYSLTLNINDIEA